ncbi:transmembrane protein 199-like isoform X3 [Mya arenaria]|uniref:transmembrane protein 199-like isoform X3 n=1 Tax=Mya arenaria TaxID=6604 RepID=UPI0022E095CA|nr:transmembrane protein 199-like isoform X3 [Mya arenaria]XP_052801356.1 transmembrane protein 199-like isoform X3 [Mya arenaria]
MEPTVTVNQRIANLFEVVSKEKNACDEGFKKDFQECLSKKQIPFRLVKKLHSFSQSGVQTCFLHELINGCDIHLPDVEKRERNPELERRCQRLQKEQDNREYRRMVHNVDKTSQQQDYFSVGKDLREMNRQMVSVFNFVITVGGAFAFGYKAIEYSFNGDTFMMQMIGGLVLATVVFFADLYFLLKENS